MKSRIIQASCLSVLTWVALTTVSAAEDLDSTNPKPPPLRECAEKRHVLIGAALNTDALRDQPKYREIAGREFSVVTPENVMKMGLLHPARDKFFWDDADALVKFAEEHRQSVHGHTLVWYNQNPPWLIEREWTRDELLDVLREHIQAVIGRYKGRVQMWDVVNEAVHEDGTLRQTIWARVIGPDYLDLAYRWAHEADPAAILLYNDYGGEGLGKKSDAIYELLRSLKSRGVPVHGVGLQMHKALNALPPENDFRANLRRLAELGLELHITEADIRIPLPVTPASLDEQAKQYAHLLRIFLEHPKARSWTTWGFTDRYSWVGLEYKNQGAALPWDENYNPKPARAALVNALCAVGP